MTKIKNTKKGMAKKTLSVSLAVAMLATSNVPVWAAEFSDGADVAAFTSEVEAPVVENEAPEVESEEVVPAEVAATTADTATISNNDIDVTGVTFPKEITWGDNITIGGAVTCAKDSNAVGSFHYGWRVQGETIDFKNDDSAVTNLSSANLSSVDPKYAGKTLELHIWRTDSTLNYDYDVVVATVKVNVQTINNTNSSFILRLKTGTTDLTSLPYCGKVYELDDKTIVLGQVTINGKGISKDDFSKYFKVTTEKKAKNNGDILIVAISANENVAGNPYVGTVTKEVPVIARTYENGDIVASYEENIKYTYTGNPINPDVSKISVKESYTSEDGDTVTGNGKLSGADLTDTIDSAVTWTVNNEGDKNAAEVGKKNVSVYLDTDKLTNFNFGQNPATIEITNAFEVEPLKLADCTVTIPTVTGGSSVLDIKPLFYKDGQLLNLGTTDYSLTVTDSTGKPVTGTLPTTGSFVATITAGASGNTLGTINSVPFRTDVLTISNIATSKTVSKEYTGKEIKPEKADFGSLTVTYKTTSNNGSSTSTASETLQANEWEIVGYSNDVTNAGDSTKHYATVKVTKEGSLLKDQTFNLGYAITPLTITAKDVTLPEKVVLDKSYTKASEYNLPVTVVAKSNDRKTTVATLSSSDYTVAYNFTNEPGKTGNVTGNKISATVTITNKNFTTNLNNTKVKVSAETPTTIVSGLLDDSCIVMNKTSYVYTGGKITPDFKVMVGTLELEKDTDYVIKDVSEAVNVGTATVVIEGRGKYADSEAKATFEITPANIEDVKLVVSDAKYKGGKQVRPDFDSTGDNGKLKVMLNDNDVSSQFEVSAYGTNINAGKEAGSITVSKLKNNTNFNGTAKTSNFDIKAAKLSGTIKVYDIHGKEITDVDSLFSYDGKEKTFATVEFTTDSNCEYADKVTKEDYEIKYVNNIYGDTNGNGSVVVIGKGNYAGVNSVKDYVNDITITSVAAKKDFAISSLVFDKTNVTVKNGVYAGGLPVKPEVIVQFGGKVLEEGKDYKLAYDTHTEVTSGKPYPVTVIGINGYKTSGTIVSSDLGKWGIDKQSIANCDVTIKDGSAIVMNGSAKVPASEYDVTDNKDNTYTITAKASSKNYTGSKTVKGTSEDVKPGKPMLVSVNVVGNKATAVLSGECDGATGYDYVISKDRDCITNKDYDKIEKNKLATQATFTYVQQGTYYAYCHAWKRDENGKKIFSDWSNAYPFVVTAITPDQPVITNVTASGSTVTVTYTQAANATGYDVVLGSTVKKVAGENRPVNYGELVKKNINGNTVTATFKNVPAGTYYAGLHAFNRTSEDGKKVFSPWSNTKKVTVK